MNRISRIKRWSIQNFKRIKNKVNWVAVIVIGVLLNIATVIDGDWFNWKMNLGLLLLAVCAAYYYD